VNSELWTAHVRSVNWAISRRRTYIASSAHGVKVVPAAERDHSCYPIYTSADSAATWTPLEQTQRDSSAFGLNLSLYRLSVSLYCQKFFRPLPADRELINLLLQRFPRSGTLDLAVQTSGVSKAQLNTALMYWLGYQKEPTAEAAANALKDPKGLIDAYLVHKAATQKPAQQPAAQLVLDEV